MIFIEAATLKNIN